MKERAKATLMIAGASHRRTEVRNTWIFDRPMCTLHGVWILTLHLLRRSRSIFATDFYLLCALRLHIYFRTQMNPYPGRSFRLSNPVISDRIQGRIRSEPNKNRSIPVGSSINPGARKPIGTFACIRSSGTSKIPIGFRAQDSDSILTEYDPF